MIFLGFLKYYYIYYINKISPFLYIAMVDVQKQQANSNMFLDASKQNLQYMTLRRIGMLQKKRSNICAYFYCTRTIPVVFN
jgi:hypothetical protein